MIIRPLKPWLIPTPIVAICLGQEIGLIMTFEIMLMKCFLLLTKICSVPLTGTVIHTEMDIRMTMNTGMQNRKITLPYSQEP